MENLQKKSLEERLKGLKNYCYMCNCDPMSKKFDVCQKRQTIENIESILIGMEQHRPPGAHPGNILMEDLRNGK